MNTPITPEELIRSRRAFDKRLGIEPECEHCHAPNAHRVVCRTAYPWNGEGENPNRDPWYCDECEAEYRAFWDGQFENLYPGGLW